jgi:hypothetical protein
LRADAASYASNTQSSATSALLSVSLTAETYTDRILGVSELRTVPATPIQIFNGNNIGPKGDLASRALRVVLSVNRPDPENRQFKHPDPIGWTESNRSRILKALYTILLGNPRLRPAHPSAAETRFKDWYHLVGSAIENAAEQHSRDDANATPISIRELFRESEADEEQSDALETVLQTIRTNWPEGCKSAEIYNHVRSFDSTGEFKAALEEAAGKPIHVVSPTTLTWRLKAIVGAPIEVDGEILVLKWVPDKGGHGGEFRADEIGH